MTAAFRAEDRCPDGSIRFACPSFNRFISWPEHRRHIADRLGMTISLPSRIKGVCPRRVLCEVGPSQLAMTANKNLTSPRSFQRIRKLERS